MADNERLDDWKAPYISYETLTNFLEKKLGSNLLPPRIDRGFLDTYAGSVQPLLLGTLKTIGFIDENHAVTDLLRRAVKGPDERKDTLREWARQFYSEQLALAEQAATAQMLHESFAKQKYSGSTLRKAVVFYLALCEDLGLPKSPHFKPPRQATSSVPTGSARRVKRVGKEAETPPPPATQVSAGQGERKKVSFGDAGTVTIEVNVKWLDLDEETFNGLRKVVRDLAALEKAAKPSAPTDEDAD